MKKLIFTIMAASILLGINGVTVFASEVTPANLVNGPKIEFESTPQTIEIKPNIFKIEREVTITRTYNSRTDIPDTYSYSIYDDKLQTWLSGNLKFQYSNQKGGKYVATFSGKIIGWIN